MYESNYRQPMTADEIFTAAGKGEELFNLAPAEDALYCRARLIYDQYRRGEYDAEQGRRRREVAMRMYDKAKETEQFQLRWVDHARELYRGVELAAAAYIHEPGYKTADALWEAVAQVEAKVQLKEAERGDFFAGK